MPTVLRRAKYSSGFTGTDYRPPAADTALFKRTDVIELFRARDRYFVDGVPAEWVGRKAGMTLYPISSSFKPSRAATGPNGRLSVIGRAADPAGEMISEEVVFPLDEDWTAYGVMIAGTTAASAAWGLVGSAGGAYFLQPRSGDLLRWSIPGASTPILSAVSSSTAYAMVELACKRSTGTFTMTRNGVQLATLSGLTISMATGRLVVMGGYDLATGVFNSFRNGGLEGLIICRGYAPEIPAQRAAVKTYFANWTPSIAIA